ncbi:hypothetical protein BLNAU_7651 [Blattamonas nauphoetae]|uniref:SH3 domain-containing protein n=1 Tax=Blattamonas nauphoetae TaxID=2049346 RepID=A0ABQ9Y0K3_9EUKA|nr:hypothetical protein BLNAU_7651 [Blattamonas nauphoetae]
MTQEGRIMYPFTRDETYPDGLTVTTDMIVEIVDDYEDDWTLARNKETGEEGFIPTSYYERNEPDCEIIVYNLPLHATEEEVFERLSHLHPTVRLQIDKRDNRKRIAFVRFTTFKELEEGLRLIPDLRLFGVQQTARRKKPQSTEVPTADELEGTCFEVMIEQLDASETQESLEELVGSITTLSVGMSVDRRDRTKKVGFVRVADQEACDEIENIVNETSRSGRPMRFKFNGVKRAPAPRSPPVSGQPQDSQSRFKPELRIQNLPNNVTEGWIMSHFDKKDVFNIRISESTTGEQFAIVKFNSFSAQEEAFSSVEMRMGGLEQTLVRPSTTTFKIVNCPRGMDQTVLRTHFCPLRITRIDVQENRSSPFLEVLLLTFESAEDMKKGIELGESLRFGRSFAHIVPSMFTPPSNMTLTFQTPLTLPVNPTVKLPLPLPAQAVPQSTVQPLILTLKQQSTQNLPSIVRPPLIKEWKPQPSRPTRFSRHDETPGSETLVTPLLETPQVRLHLPNQHQQSGLRQRFVFDPPPPASNSAFFVSQQLSVFGNRNCFATVLEGVDCHHSLLTFSNCSSEMSFFAFSPDSCHAVSLTDGSKCTLSHCDIRPNDRLSSFITDKSDILVSSCSFTFNPSRTSSQSLVSSNGCYSSACFVSCHVEDVHHVTNQPFLASTTLAQVSLSECTLSNFSVNARSAVPTVAKISNVSISDSHFKLCEEVLYGGIVSDMNSGASMHALNTTFSHCSSNVDTTMNNGSMERVELAASHSFISCVWTSTTTTGTGGAINVDKSGDLFVDKCTITQYTATTASSNGGGIFFRSEATFQLLVNNSVIDQCTSYSYSGALYGNNSSKLEIMFSNFTKNIAKVHIAGCYFWNLPAGTLIQNLRFEFGYVESETGHTGFLDCANPTGNSHYSNLLFNQNSAGRGGANLYGATKGGQTVSWFSCIFYKNEARDKFKLCGDDSQLIPCGNDFYFLHDREDWNATLADPTTFANCFSTSDWPRVAINWKNLTTHNVVFFPDNKTSLSSIFPDPGVILSKRAEALDDPQCGGHYALPCATLSYVFSDRLSASTGEVLVEAGLYEETQNCVKQTKDATITSYGNANPQFEVQANSGVFLSVDSDLNLKLKWLSIFAMEGTQILEHRGTGEVTVESCVMGTSGDVGVTRSGSGVSLIAVLSGTFTMTESELRWCSTSRTLLSSAGSTHLHSSRIVFGGQDISDAGMGEQGKTDTPLIVVDGGEMTIGDSSISDDETEERTGSIFRVSGGTVSISTEITIQHPTFSFPLVTLSSGSLDMTGTSLTTPQNGISGSSSLLEQNGGTLTMNGMRVERVAKAEGDGSVILAALSASSHSLHLSDMTFVSCCCLDGYGGVLHVSLTNDAVLEVDGTTVFSSCLASGNGQSLYLSHSDLVSLLAIGRMNSIKPSLPANNALFTPTQKNQFFGYESPTSEGSLLFFWFPFEDSDGAVHVHAEGTNHKHCGKAGLACQSLNFGSGKMLSTKTVELDSGIELSELWEAEGGVWTLKQNGAFSMTIVGDGQIRIHKPSTELTLDSLSFVHDALTLGRTNPLISVSTGSLVFSSCSLGSVFCSVCVIRSGDIEITDTSFISLSTSPSNTVPLSVLSLQIGQGRRAAIGKVDEPVLFSSCVLSGGGEVFGASVSQNGILSLSFTSFVSCSCSGLGVFALDTTQLLSADSLSFNSISFGSIADNTLSSSGVGKPAVFVSVADLSDSSFLSALRTALLPTEPANSLFFNSTERDLVQFGKQGDDALEGVASVLFAFHKPTDSLHIRSVDGVDHSLCGHTFLPCLSLAPSFATAASVSTVDKIVLDTDISLSSQVTMSTATITLTSSDTAKTIRLSDSAAFSVESGDWTLESLSFVSDELTLGRSTPMISVSTGSLVFSSCSLGSLSSALSVPFVSITGGSVTMNGATILTFDSLAAPLVSISSGNLELDWTTLSGTCSSSTSLFSLSGGTTNLKSTITSLLPQANVFVLTSTAVLNVESGLHTLNSNNIHTLLTMNGGKVTMTSSSFSSASLLSTFIEGNGDIEITDTSFSSLSTSPSNTIPLSVLSLQIGQGRKATIGKVDEPVLFSSCVLSGGGEVFGASVSHNGLLTLSFTSFVSCSCSGLGVFALDTTQLLSADSLSFNSISFGSIADNSLSSSGAGKPAVFVYVADLSDSSFLSALRSALLPAQPANSLFFNTTERDLVQYGGQNEDGSEVIMSVLYAFHKPTDSLHIRSVDGVDHSLCGHTFLPCLSLAPSFATASSIATVDKIVLDTDISLSSQVTMNTATITLTSSDTAKTIRLSDSAAFSVGSGDWTLKNVIIELPASLSASLFSITGGTLTLTPSSRLVHPDTQQTPTALSAPLFSLTKGSLSINGLQTSPQVFSSFSGNTVIFVDGSDQPSLSLSRCHFLDCSASTSQLAGALVLSGLKSGSILLSDCYFARNTGSSSHDVFASDEWTGTINDSSILRCFSESDFDHLVVHDKPLNDLIPYSILQVSPTSADNENCDQPDIPCSTVSVSLGFCIQKENDKSTYALRLISIEEDVSETDVLDVGERRVQISGKDESITLSCGAASGQLLKVSEGWVKMVSLRLAHRNGDTSTLPLLELTAQGALILSEIGMDGANNSLAMPLIRTSAGSLSLSSVSIESFSLSAHPLIESSSPLSISHSTFSSITRDTTNPSPTVVLATITLSIPVSVTDTSFTSCVSSTEPRWIELVGTNPDTIRPTSWTNTFNHSSPPSSVVVRVPEWEHDPKFNPFSLLYLFSQRSEGIAVVSEGKSVGDHPLCGSSQMACLSIDGSVELTRVRTLEVLIKASLNNQLSIGQKSLTITGSNGEGRLQFVADGRISSDDPENPGKTTLLELTLDFSRSSLGETTPALLIQFGTLVVTSCSVESTKVIASPIVMMSGSTLTMEKVNLFDLSYSTIPFQFDSAHSITLSQIEMSNTTHTQLISASSCSKVILDSCHFTGITSPVSSNTEDLCEWSTGLIGLKDSNATIRSSMLIDLDLGGVWMEDSEVSLEVVTFHDNTPNDDVFTSARKNIRCVGESVVKVGSLYGGDGSESESESMWISADSTCSVLKNKTQTSSPFFVPKLDTEKSKSTQLKNKTLSVEVVGTLLIPCGLELNVFEIEKSTILKSTPIALNASNINKWNETHITLQLSPSSLSLNQTFEWRARLGFGEGETSSNSFLLKPSAAAERKAQMGKVMTIVGPILGFIFALFFLIVIVIVCVRRRRGEKKEKQKEMKELDVEMEVEDKMDVLDFANPNGNNTNLLVHDSEIESSKAEGKQKANLTQKEMPRESSLAPAPVEMVDAIRGEDCVKIRKVNKLDTLYSRLHSSTTPFKMNKRLLQRQITDGLSQLAMVAPDAQTLTKLTSHWIVFENDQPLFKVSEADPQQSLRSHPTALPTPSPTDQSDPQSNHNPLAYPSTSQYQQHPSSLKHSFFESGPTMETAVGQDYRVRWQAPEQIKESRMYDPHKAAVFRLGLVLWEIETESIPFGEQDAVNANRSLTSGILPSMSGVKDSQMVELITSCLSLNPSQRPTLSGVCEVLSEKKNDIAVIEGGTLSFTREDSISLHKHTPPTTNTHFLTTNPNPTESRQLLNRIHVTLDSQLHRFGTVCPRQTPLS